MVSRGICEISGISTRKLQRIEGGEKANTETLRAIAAALSMEVATLLPVNTLMPESEFVKTQAQLQAKAQKEAAQVEKELNVLPRMRDGKELLSVVASVEALNTDHPHPVSEEEASAMTDLVGIVRDYGDIHNDLEPQQQMANILEATRYIERLESLGWWCLQVSYAAILSVRGQAVMCLRFVCVKGAFSFAMPRRSRLLLMKKAGRRIASGFLMVPSASSPSWAIILPERRMKIKLWQFEYDFDQRDAQIVIPVPLLVLGLVFTTLNKEVLWGGTVADHLLYIFLKPNFSAITPLGMRSCLGSVLGARHAKAANSLCRGIRAIIQTNTMPATCATVAMKQPCWLATGCSGREEVPQ